jgi:hypothetical protein
MRRDFAVVIVAALAGSSAAVAGCTSNTGGIWPGGPAPSADSGLPSTSGDSGGGTLGAGQTCFGPNDCRSTLACAPSTDANGNPTSAYVCKPIDGQPYDGCSAIERCTGCCVVDARGDTFCANYCNDDAGSPCGGSGICQRSALASWSACTVGSLVCVP